MKATGLQGDASPEIIEILDDDTNAFGDRAPSHTMHDTNGPRWIGPAAAAALVALIGYGVATSASTPSAPKASPITSSTVVTSTTQPPPPTTVPPPAAPAYTAFLLTGFTPMYAQRFDAAAVQASVSSSTSFELWGTTDASATTGRWFAITVDRYGGSIFSADNAYRTTMGELPVVVTRAADGLTTLQFSTNQVNSVTITSFGWDEQELARLVTAVRVDALVVTFVDMWFTVDHSKLTTVSPWTGFDTAPAQQLGYVSADGTKYLAISVQPVGSPADDEARQIGLRFLLDHRTLFVVDVYTAVAGTVVATTFSGQGGEAEATWVDGDNIITVNGSVSLPELIAVARTVRQVSEREWQTLEKQAQQPQASADTAHSGTPYVVATGTAADGREWMIRGAVISGATASQTVWQSAAASWSGESGGGHAGVVTHVDSSLNYVSADLPRAVAATAELHIMRDGLDPVVVPFNDVDPAIDRTFAAYAFSEPVQYTAEIVAPDGAVLATWPSP